LSKSLRIIARKTLVQAWTKHPTTEQPLKAWFQDAKTAQWDSPEDIRTQYPTASIVGNERVVFNIKGNAYRLVVAVNYSAKIVYIKFFGTHAEYDKINVEEVQP
jgi:mRNA interferase HigB